jgi:hypothetical protein
MMRPSHSATSRTWQLFGNDRLWQLEIDRCNDLRIEIGVRQKPYSTLSSGGMLMLKSGVCGESFGTAQASLSCYRGVNSTPLQ